MTYTNEEQMLGLMNAIEKNQSLIAKLVSAVSEIAVRVKTLEKQIAELEK